MTAAPWDGQKGRVLIGYTAGVYDLFHVGHLNLLRNARAMCDRLIVGVTTDEVARYKRKDPVMPFSERIELVRACRYVDVAVAQVDLDKFAAWERVHYDRLFVGDDWFGHASWKNYETKLAAVGAQVIYLPYTQGTSSTKLQQALEVLVAERH